MIPRYSRPEMGRLWSDENRFGAWLRVELAATEIRDVYDFVYVLRREKLRLSPRDHDPFLRAHITALSDLVPDTRAVENLFSDFCTALRHRNFNMNPIGATQKR